MKVKHYKSDNAEAIEFYKFPVKFAIAKDFFGIQICSNGYFYSGNRAEGKFSYKNMYDATLDVLENLNKVWFYFLVKNIKYRFSKRWIKFQLKTIRDLLTFKYVYTFYDYSDNFVSKLEGKTAILLEDKLIRLYRFLWKKKFNFHLIYKHCYSGKRA